MAHQRIPNPADPHPWHAVYSERQKNLLNPYSKYCLPGTWATRVNIEGILIRITGQHAARVLHTTVTPAAGICASIAL